MEKKKYFYCDSNEAKTSFSIIFTISGQMETSWEIIQFISAAHTRAIVYLENAIYRRNHVIHPFLVN